MTTHPQRVPSTLVAVAGWRRHSRSIRVGSRRCLALACLAFGLACCGAPDDEGLFGGGNAGMGGGSAGESGGSGGSGGSAGGSDANGGSGNDGDASATGGAAGSTMPHDVGRDAGGNYSSAIGDCWLQNGGQPAAGLPFDNGGGKWVHQWGPGRVQDFAGGSLGPNICMHAFGSPVAWMVRGDIRKAYLEAGGGKGPLSYPANDEYSSDTGPRQDFAHGYITWDDEQAKFQPYY